MPKACSEKHRSRPYLSSKKVDPKEANKCTDKECRCSLFPGSTLKKAKGELASILKGQEKTPQYLEESLQPRVWNRKPARFGDLDKLQTWVMRSRDLSRLHKSALAHELEKQNVAQDYPQWQKRYEALELKPDAFMEAMCSPELSPRIRELQQEFARVGVEQFACPEFRTVIENIQRLVSFEMQQKDCYAVEEFKAFHDQLQKFLNSSHSLPYQDVHRFCCHFITLMEEYERGLYEGEQDERKKGMELLNNISRDDWLTGTMFCDCFCQGGQIKALIPITMPLTGLSKKRMLWPTFAPMVASDFEKIARYDISPLGLLVSHKAFHDGVLFNRREFYDHDCLHDNRLPVRRNLDSQRCQSVLKTRQHLIEQITDDPVVKDICGKLGFVQVHELLSNKVDVDGYDRGIRFELLEKMDDYKDVTDWFARRLYYFDDLPAGLKPRHIQGGCYVLNQIEPWLPKTESA
ncbi:hypothetical protein [Parendozoicomonas haliclonae]|uniref:Uncharacterized protein n=1 Tax=Parendozoicomonas haliclonae TaxID=1960125 RepID=A0A1X7APH1_9GAMM|nr:hypothetical protein [Parendozoicomonas haliclonae]SMA50204.1 hypothetical protein EHSB41UT_03997 [Parendozoicomonas haliclonae]